MHAERNHAQPGAGQHHDRVRPVAGQLGKIVGVSIVPETGLAQGQFMDRVGDQRRCPAGNDEIDRIVDRRNHRTRMGWIGRSGYARRCQRPRQYRRSMHKGVQRFLRRADGNGANRPVQVPGQRGQPVRVVDHEKRRYVIRLAGKPRLERDFTADAGRFPHRERNRQGHVSRADRHRPNGADREDSAAPVN